MSWNDVNTAFGVLDLRERLIFKLGILVGMRCSEIYGLRRGRIQDDRAVIAERVSRRDIDTPKTEKSYREVAFPSGLREDLKSWLDSSPDLGPDGWLFPSENPAMPMGADNMMARYIKPRLRTVRLEWIDYRVLRRTHSSLMRELAIDPKLIADQQGHTVDINLNVCASTSVESRLVAVQSLESRLIH